MPKSIEQFGQEIATALRAISPDGKLWDADVGPLNTLAEGFCRRQVAEPAASASGPSGLADPTAFFASLRSSLGPLTEGQVAGFNRLLAAMAADRWPVAHVSYGLATPWWETNKKMEPVEEGYYLGPERAKRHQRSLRYYPWYGRGDVQLTWEDNYRKADKALGLGGALVADPNKALDPEISARILVWGMKTGAFTGKRLADTLPATGVASTEQFRKSRPIINAMDKAAEIAAVAFSIQKAVVAGGWK